MLEGIVIGVVGMAALVGIVMLLVKMAKKPKVKKSRKQTTAVLTEAEKEYVINEFSGQNVPFKVNEDVHGEMSNLYVDFVSAYGTRYRSIDNALSACKDLTEDERVELENIDASLSVVRGEQIAARRFLRVQELLDEEIYIYEPCKMKIDVASRNNKPARIAVEIARQDKKMVIESIYVSKKDVTVTAGRYEFDMMNEDDVESLSLLVRDSAEFKDEVAEIAKIERHLNRFNELVDNGRVGQDRNGEIIIFPPSPEEIKAKAAKKKAPVDMPVDKEAKEQVEEEFVSSSTVAGK